MGGRLIWVTVLLLLCFPLCSSCFLVLSDFWLPLFLSLFFKVLLSSCLLSCLILPLVWAVVIQGARLNSPLEIERSSQLAVPRLRILVEVPLIASPPLQRRWGLRVELVGALLTLAEGHDLLLLSRSQFGLLWSSPLLLLGVWGELAATEMWGHLPTFDLAWVLGPRRPPPSLLATSGWGTTCWSPSLVWPRQWLSLHFSAR